MKVDDALVVSVVKLLIVIRCIINAAGGDNNDNDKDVSSIIMTW